MSLNQLRSLRAIVSGSIALATGAAMLLSPATPASALVVESSGGGSGIPAGFLNDKNVANLGPASSVGCVYLGNGYVLTAYHVTSGSKFNVAIDGTTYSYTSDPIIHLNNTVVQANFGGSWSTFADLMVFRLSGVPSTIPQITLATAPAVNGEQVEMTGWGLNRAGSTSTFLANNTAPNGYNSAFGGSPISESGYLWGGVNQFKQYGQNKIPATGINLYQLGDGGANPGDDTLAFATVFNAPATGDALANEAALALGDSGAPAFIQRAGVYQLAGINNEVELLLRGTPPSTVTGAVFAAPYASATFDSRSFMADLYYYQSQYASLIPEPTSISLLAFGAGLMLRRSRRKA